MLRVEEPIKRFVDLSRSWEVREEWLDSLAVLFEVLWGDSLGAVVLREVGLQTRGDPLLLLSLLFGCCKKFLVNARSFLLFFSIRHAE